MSNTPKSDPYALPPFDRGNLVASLICALVVIIAGVGGSLLLWAMRDQLPELVAVHWGADGRADGFQRVADSYLTNAVVVMPISLLLVALGGVAKQGRLLGPIAAGTAVFMSVLMNGSAIAQRGLTAEQVQQTQVGIVMLYAFLLAVAIGVGLGLIFRRRRKPGEGPAPVRVGDGEPRLLVDDSVTVAWTGRTNVPRAVWILLGGSALACLIPAAMSALAGSWSTVIMMVVIAVLVLAIGASMAADVAIDARWVRVRGLSVIPWVTVPLDDIAGATVTKVSPLGDFGGWGLRVGRNGEKGFVTASGPAVRIEQGSAPAVVITLSDAEAAAATINTLVTRRAGA